ncbi:MAG TPA: hypothetical protein VER33_26710 [Polyangiaceae bacterium]|nr:hypothetical protein [Polyangiaceae bacterium]
MQRPDWRNEVARLLEHAAHALRVRNDRHAIVAFGTAVGYLQKARENADSVAAQLLAQTSEAAADGPTERFTFKPGELEALKNPVGE